jgi:SnoaL-like domain
MTHEQFQQWLDRYVEAWKTYDPDKISSLFSDDADYSYHPQDDPEHGRAAILEAWLTNPDEKGTYDAEYHPLAIDADGMHVASGWSRYYDAPGGNMRDEYLNVYVCRFNDAGECTEFIEYWIQNREMRKKSIDEIVTRRMADAGQPPAGSSAA